MKLFTRYNRINLLATVFIFLLASMVFYFFLRFVLERQVDEDLEIEKTEIVTYAERHGRLPEMVQQEDQLVFYVPTDQPVKDTRFETIPAQAGKEDHRQIWFSVDLPQGWYNVKVSKSLEGTDQLTNRVATIAFTTILIMLIASFAVNRLVLRRLWQPFYHTLTAMQQFRLGKNETLNLPESHIDEFQFMNTTLQQAMQKAGQDYILLKEFTENAAHELQTPLAIIRSKLELLMQYNLDAAQSNAVQSAGAAVNTLSRFNKSLLLLAKIQNHQFADTAELNLKTIIEDKLEAFMEISAAKGITLHKALQQVHQTINPDLAGLLISNLVSNAIKHNKPGGKMHMELTHTGLVVSNTGAPVALDENRLFTRFYNPDKAATSTGLGLAIVKQICDASGYRMEYLFRDAMHHFRVLF